MQAKARTYWYLVTWSDSWLVVPVLNETLTVDQLVQTEITCECMIANGYRPGEEVRIRRYLTEEEANKAILDPVVIREDWKMLKEHIPRYLACRRSASS